jgi:hypothetical protein
MTVRIIRQPELLIKQTCSYVQKFQDCYHTSEIINLLAQILCDDISFHINSNLWVTDLQPNRKHL